MPSSAILGQRFRCPLMSGAYEAPEEQKVNPGLSASSLSTRGGGPSVARRAARAPSRSRSKKPALASYH